MVYNKSVLASLFFFAISNTIPRDYYLRRRQQLVRMNHNFNLYDDNDNNNNNKPKHKTNEHFM
jgi:hypothetical protein